MSNNLIPGKLNELLQARKFTTQFCVQVYEIKTVPTKQDIVKAKVHDSKTSITAIVRCTGTDAVKNLKEFSIIRITNAVLHVPTDESKTLVLAINNFDTVDKTQTKMLGANLLNVTKLNQVSQAPHVRAGVPTSHSAAVPADLSKAKITPFAMLTAMQNKSTIKGRVISKQDKFKYAKGNLFNFVLQDKEGGELRATAFNDMCDALYDTIQVGSTYYISKGEFKVPTNKNYRSAKMIDVDMVVGRYTTVQKAEDELPAISSITAISDLLTSPVDSLYDICGVLVQVKDEDHLKNDKIRRSILVADQTKHVVSINFWGEDAAIPERLEPLKTYVFRQVQLREFRTRNMNYSSRSSSIIEGEQIAKYDETSLVHKMLDESKTSTGEYVFDRPTFIYLDETTTADSVQGTKTEQSKLFKLSKFNEAVLASEEDIKGNVYAYFTSFKTDSTFYYVSCPSCKRKSI
ncbi:replication factor A 1, rfa1, putative [Entamoeba invadens IP1]|uniref:replication factor A 1, rfa1, putative n=1 Tax=Entamoeba invadens IP1 TaxID=370355 RepID=UPI0002C3DC84|nr:replication factor A 1, rfa1, putative [Entamoeba invadens IP1]ELP94012.1 replication factor A 1, rfa1, putative [Entamoeba invadens IP1]|eukprot:XP_004260783.1 replication factor A 1, rfa1, putative [Entamoeba invadens IP1]